MRLSANRPSRYALAVLCMATVWLGSAQTSLAQDPQTLVSTFVNRTIEEIIKPNISNAERRSRFRLVLREGLDIPAIARFALGRYWRRTDEDARQAFLKAFESILIVRFLPLLRQYSGERIIIGAVRVRSDDRALITVPSRLLRPQDETVAVEWRLKRVGKRYKIVDVIAEGISIAVMLRSEYGSFLQRHKGDVVALTAAIEKQLRATGETTGRATTAVEQ